MSKSDHAKHAVFVVLTAIAPALIEVLGPQGAFGHKAWAAPALAVVLWCVRALGATPPTAAAALLLTLLPFLAGAICIRTPAGPTPPADGGISFVNCSDAAIHQAALNILPSVENALAVDGYEAKLATLIASLAGPLALAEVECAVAWVESKAERDVTVTADSLSAAQAAHAKAWLAAHPVTFAIAGAQ